jgi:hypothetical protein
VEAYEEAINTSPSGGDRGGELSKSDKDSTEDEVVCSVEEALNLRGSDGGGDRSFFLRALGGDRPSIGATARPINAVLLPLLLFCV